MQIQQCLSNSLEMAAQSVPNDGLVLEIDSRCMEFNQKINLEKSFAIEDEADDDEEGKQHEEKKQ